MNDGEHGTSLKRERESTESFVMRRDACKIAGLIIVLFRADGFHLFDISARRSQPTPITPLSAVPGERVPCFFRSRASGKWKPRLELSDLTVGQELEDCHVVQELLDAKTGPKLFVDCGVGRCHGGKWKIVNGMLRLDRKQSAARKRASRLRKKSSFSAFVSRIRPENQQFEVAIKQVQDRPKKVPVSSLKAGEQVTGTVERLEDYGALVDVGANRHGLLHIQRVADLYGRYIDKAKGLSKAGLERGARLRLKVASNEQSRLFLDFTDDVKEDSGTDKEAETAQQTEFEERPTDSSAVSSKDGHSSTTLISDEEATAWAEYADYAEEEVEEEEYDEDRDIEDALGLGTY